MHYLWKEPKRIFSTNQ
jgi:hypothetical protein